MEALYHVSDGDNKRTIRDMVRSVVQFNSDGLDHSHGHRGRGWLPVPVVFGISGPNLLQVP